MYSGWFLKISFLEGITFKALTKLIGVGNFHFNGSFEGGFGPD